ncbi:MAG: putative porin [Blastocatellia bacterium]|nr:putative porin [Blastocatellia bacterium]
MNPRQTRSMSSAACAFLAAMFLCPVAFAGDEGTGKPVPTPAASGTAAATVEDQLRRQTELLERLERLVVAQQERIDRLEAEMEGRTAESVTASGPASPGAISTPVSASIESSSAGVPATSPDDDALSKRLEEVEKRFGNIKFSGDIRFRYEGFYNLGFDLPVDVNARNRYRVRVRAGITGKIDNHFDWGLRLTTGSFTDPISSNQSLTDFYERKPIAVDRAFLHFTTDSKPVNLDIHAGKFEPTWKKTAFTFDNDLQVEGLSERLKFKVSDDDPLRSVTLTAWQLPYRERSVGADAFIFGGQILTDWTWSKNWSSTLSGTFHDFEQINVIPPALGGSPTVVNSVIEYGTTNTVVRNPFTDVLEYRSDFRVINVLGELTYKGIHPRFPLLFSVEWLRNTSAFNNEKDGGHAYVILGQRKQQGDWYFDYGFMKAEREVFPSVFMESDVLQTNSVNHWATAAYMIRKNIELSGRYFFERRLQTLSPENRWLNRFQLDMVYSF